MRDPVTCVALGLERGIGISGSVMCGLSAFLCLGMLVALPNFAHGFLVPAKPQVDERGLDRGAAAEVEERLRRWIATPKPGMLEHERPLFEAWTDFRRNAGRWAPALCRIAMKRRHPLRLEAISALRFFGSEHAWEHRSHARKGTPCILGKEPYRDDCEGTLRSLAHEQGEVRWRTLEALAAFRTPTAASCLASWADEENATAVWYYLRWQAWGSWDASPKCGFARWGGPETLFICGNERRHLNWIREERESGLRGDQTAVPSNEKILESWNAWMEFGR